MSCWEPEFTEVTVGVGAPTLDDADAERRGDGGGRGIVRDVLVDILLRAWWQEIKNKC